MKNIFNKNVWNKKKAIEITGGLSVPSKMPCYSYNIPAENCNVGSKLVHIEGSVCSKCYALKGRYPFPNVQNAMKKRLKALDNPKWVKAMIFLIKSTKIPWFRWHDSGDIQDEKHLKKICKVAEGTPDVKHWLPTREYYTVSEYVRKGNKIPPNLEIRLSSFMIEGNAPTDFAKKLGLTTSGVSKDSFTCPAHNQGNKCCDCRACWDKNVPNVTYKLHFKTPSEVCKCGYNNSISKVKTTCLYCGEKLISQTPTGVTKSFTTSGINSVEHALNHVYKHKKTASDCVYFNDMSFYWEEGQTSCLSYTKIPRESPSLGVLYSPLRRWEITGVYLAPKPLHNVYVRYKLKDS